VLKEYLVKGYALNQRRLAEKRVAELRGVLDLLAGTLEQHRLVNDTGLVVLDLVRRYGLTWSLLLQYDEDRLAPHAGAWIETVHGVIMAEIQGTLYLIPIGKSGGPKLLFPRCGSKPRKTLPA
jgi:hypothetical protein